MSDISVIIPAAGEGRRMGGSVGKQFMLLDGVPIFIRTLRPFCACNRVRQIVVVTMEQTIDEVRTAIDRWKISKVAAVIAGGHHRQESVIRGFRAFGRDAAGIVMVHDAVRPFVRESDIIGVADAAEIHGAAVIGIQPTDTIKISADGQFYESTLDRSRLWSVQTPQAFTLDVYDRACAGAEKDGFIGTDDAELAERIGIKVKIVPGHADNIKVTYPTDIALAERILAGAVDDKTQHLTGE